jgi:hypothetical protein
MVPQHPGSHLRMDCQPRQPHRRSNSSDLVLSDSQGRAPWATKNNITGAAVAAVLLDTGNFVLHFLNGTTIWESFQHPTDTILPGMKIFLSEKARVVGGLIAWKSPIDPSSGDFSLSLDLSSNYQLVIWHGTTPYTQSCLKRLSAQVMGSIMNSLCLLARRIHVLRSTTQAC